VRISTVAEEVSAHPLLAGLPSDLISEVGGCARNVAFPAGALLLAEGDPADTVYLVRRGRVAIEVQSPGPGSLVIETVGPGSVVGFSWLLPPYSWRFDARALDPVGAMALSAACMREKADRDPAVGYALMSRVAGILLERLQATRVRMLDIYGTADGG
jgi:CRP-like cAMP-binding protein